MRIIVSMSDQINQNEGYNGEDREVDQEVYVKFEVVSKGFNFLLS